MASINIEALKAERAALVAANEAATSWGAAVGARHERIKEIDRTLALAPTPSLTNPNPKREGIDHEFKSHPDVFWPAARGEKTFEFRKDDRGGYQVGQTVRLRCFADGSYTADAPLDRVITNILRPGEFGLQDGYCILSLAYPEGPTKVRSISVGGKALADALDAAGIVETDDSGRVFSIFQPEVDLRSTIDAVAFDLSPSPGDPVRADFQQRYAARIHERATNTAWTSLLPGGDAYSQGTQFYWLNLAGIASQEFKALHPAAAISVSTPTGEGEALDPSKDGFAPKDVRPSSDDVHAWISRAYRDPKDTSQMDAARFTRWNMEVAFQAGFGAGYRARPLGHTKMREALMPFAELNLPLRPQGNSGFYSIRFRDIERAAEVINTPTATGEGQLREVLFRLKTECEIEGLDGKPGFDGWVAWANKLLDLKKGQHLSTVGTPHSQQTPTGEGEAMRWAINEMADAASAVSSTAPSEAQMSRLHSAAEKLLDLRDAALAHPQQGGERDASKHGGAVMTEWWANVYVYTHVDHGKFCEGAQRRLSRFRAECEAEESLDRNRFRIHVRLKPVPNAPNSASKSSGEEA